MTNRLRTLCLALIVALATAVAAHAVPGPERTMHLTFDRSVALPGVTLPSGSYVFERATPLTSHHVVRVTSRDRRRVFFQGFTELVDRPDRWPEDQPVSIGEPRRDAPAPILVWYPDGVRQGHRFLY